MASEQETRVEIDALLGAAGWLLCNVSTADICAAGGVDVPEFVLDRLFKTAEPIDYNPAIPIETFDILVTDGAHRSIYKLARQLLEYFDASLIGLTATPSRQTFGFFNQNLVMEYGHEQAVADGVNVNYDVYRIKTKVTEAGAKVEAGYG